MKIEIDLDKPRKFFGPHPGIGGAMVPLPQAARRAARELDGQTLPLREVVARLEALALGRIRIVVEFSYIQLNIGDWKKGETQHTWRIIRFSE